MNDIPQDRYTHGHHESVVQNHARRRAEVDAWFLLPHLNRGNAPAGCRLRPGHNNSWPRAGSRAGRSHRESTSRKMCWRKRETMPRQRMWTT